MSAPSANRQPQRTSHHEHSNGQEANTRQQQISNMEKDDNQTEVQQIQENYGVQKLLRTLQEATF